MKKLDLSFKNTIKEYGKGNWNECYHCGSCTAICKHTEENFLFPRKTIRNIQMGLKQNIDQGVEPWLCYYCGDCTESCPRNANPGEILMATRRYLTTLYDWTGLSKVFYTSLPATIIAFLIIANSLLGISFYFGFNMNSLLQFGHKFELYTIISIALVFLLPNVLRMLWYILGKSNAHLSKLSIFSALWTVPVHMFSQIESLKCRGNFNRWLLHLLLVIGYLSLLFLTVFLDWFYSQNNFVIILGYLVGSLTFIITFIYINGRIRKKAPISKFSHHTDWMFIVWLFLMGLTAFMVRLFIDLNLLGHNIWLYIAHLIILAQWALIIVPFGKWSHFLYRSFAMYAYQVKKDTLSKAATNRLTLKTT